jgi:predicted metal-dependent phosphotriesterase family hydrolase
MNLPFRKRMIPLTEPAIQTVTGPVRPDEIGFTLPAEHLYIASSSPDAWQLNDEDVFAAELKAFTDLGGTCLVDLTPPGMGRNPAGLAALSRRSGVAIVMSTGWYTDASLPPEDLLDRRTTGDIAEQLITEITRGAAETGIRPGIIGEFGPVRGWLSPMDERLHRAYARAQQATGVPLSTHAWRCEVGLVQLDLLEEEGVNPRRVSIGHCDSWPVLSYWQRIAERGAYVQLDNLSLQPPAVTALLVRLVREMVDLGYAEHLLFSHDLAQAEELRYLGGHGLTYVSEHFLPALTAAGVPPDVLRAITVSNPRTLLTVTP